MTPTSSRTSSGTSSALLRLAAHPVPRRIGEAVLTLLGVSILTFLVLRVLPGDQITASYGVDAGDLSGSQRAQLRSYYGLDKPLAEQYFSWLGGILHGRLGYSANAGQSVAHLTAHALPVTLELAVLAIALALLLGVCGGMIAASRPGALRDGAAQTLSLLALSAPVFLTGTVLARVLADSFGWNPNGETYAPPTGDLPLNLQQMVLPALVLGVSIASPVAQTTRAAVLDVRGEDFVTTVRAKGVTERALQVRHVLRNALIPVVTMSGLQFGFLLGGAVVVEQIFSLPGIGRQVLLGMGQKEYAVVQSTVLVIAVLFVVVNLATDLVYRLVDPRVWSR
ncbi:ABC transporter permease [Streptomyces sp. VRA16 Mangrove soil]|uniref:ABC transporter permease n=1 Tax=Streptomyces sp. VRA16 Mangrove soil TaxID=2817434 RepID=UPI001A9E4C21|nr:ABC transporter permease [Streptomyces sp. VRA16 Mangrove soil]MBO1330091.1 ABC transporter permease [Streptomyces sp. VRA16 Mangrove soil]